MSTSRSFRTTARDADLARLVAARSSNLRRLLLRASRIFNREIVEELVRRGYPLRGTHMVLLSNLDEVGTSLSEVANRAGISKQAMGRVADELEAAGFVKSVVDRNDRRTRLIRFTKKGWALMLESFEIFEAIEDRYTQRIGVGRLEELRVCLHALIDASDTDSCALRSL